MYVYNIHSTTLQLLAIDFGFLSYHDTLNNATPIRSFLRAGDGRADGRMDGREISV